jgi:hypothetical protein
MEARIRMMEQGGLPPSPYDIERGYQQSDRVSHAGGLWVCTARSGARPGDEPSPTSAHWLLASNGVSSVRSEMQGDRRLRVVLRMASGAEHEAVADLSLPTWRGTWEPSRSYGPGDMVVSNGSTWICRAPSIGDRPPGTAWSVMAMRGRTGPAASTREVEALERRLQHWLSTAGDPRSIRERVQDRARDIYDGQVSSCEETIHGGVKLGVERFERLVGSMTEGCITEALKALRPDLEATAVRSEAQRCTERALARIAYRIGAAYAAARESESGDLSLRSYQGRLLDAIERDLPNMLLRPTGRRRRLDDARAAVAEYGGSIPDLFLLALFDEPVPLGDDEDDEDEDDRREDAA